MPRVAVGCAAMAMTALTLDALVILPSQLENASQPSATFALSSATFASIRARVQFLWRRSTAAVAHRDLSVSRKSTALPANVSKAATAGIEARRPSGGCITYSGHPGVKGWYGPYSRRSSTSVGRPCPTQTRPWRFPSRLAGVLCKRPFTEIVEKIGTRSTDVAFSLPIYMSGV